MARGGKRQGAGRKKTERVTDSDVASRVLAKSNAEQTWLSMVELEKRKLGINKDGTLSQEVFWKASVLPLKVLLHYLEDRAHGRTIQQIRMANPEGEKFQVEVDVTSARDKLINRLIG